MLKTCLEKYFLSKFHSLDPEMTLNFSKIVGVHEILKDEEKRKRYNEILEFGLPDWREPIYYYRRARKLSFTELILAISVVIIIGHYFVMWAQYFERRLCLVSATLAGPVPIFANCGRTF
jgi:hypothetical protein